MAVTGNKGIDIRQTANRIIARVLLQTSAGALVTTGTTNLSLLELQTDGTIKTYDFSSNTFKASGMTSGQSVAAMSYRARIGTADAAVDTGLWTYVLSTLSGFTAAGIYFAVVNNSGASPTDQIREFQFGDAEGDLQVDSSGYYKVSTGTGTGQLSLTAGKIAALLAAADVTGNLPALVNSMANNVITAAAIAAAALNGKGDWLTGDSSGVVTLLTRLSAACAAYLDFLNIGGLVASQADAQNIQKNTWIGTNIPLVLERPDSSSEAVQIVITFADDTGAAADIDSSANPTIALINNASTSLASRLGSWAHPATGKYTTTYTNSASDALENIHWEITGTVNSKLRRHVITTQLVDTTAVDFTSADRTTLQSLATEANATTNKTAVLTAVGSPMQAGASATLAASQPNYAPAKAGDAMTLTGAYDAAKTAATATAVATVQTTATAAAGSAATAATQATNAANNTSGLAAFIAKFTGISSLANWLRAAMRKDAPDTTAATEINATTNSVAGSFDATTDSLQAIRDRGDSTWTGGGGGGGNAGDGDIPVNHNTGGTDALRVTRSGVGVDNVSIRAYLKADYDAGDRTVRAEAFTGTDGRWETDMMLDDGIYVLTFSATGYTIPNAEVTVSAD